jgi:hypothetical protein
MNVQQQPTPDGQAAGSSSTEAPRDGALRQPSDLLSQQARLWSDYSRFWISKSVGISPARMLMPPVDACFSVLEDWRAFAQSAAEQLEEDAKTLRDSWQEMTQCKTPEDYSKTGNAVREKLTKQWTKSTQKMATLAGEHATRRWRSNTELATSVVKAAEKT